MRPKRVWGEPAAAPQTPQTADALPPARADDLEPHYDPDDERLNDGYQELLDQQERECFSPDEAWVSYRDWLRSTGRIDQNCPAGYASP